MRNCVAATCFVTALVGLSSLASVRGASIGFGSGDNQFTMEFVPIGNSGNRADTSGTPKPAGSVPYAFSMGKYEVSEDMIVKANAAAGLGIPMDRHGANQPAAAMACGADVETLPAARHVVHP